VNVSQTATASTAPSHAAQRYVLTLQCADQPGIVHAIAGAVFKAGGNIVDSSQFSDPTTGTFFLRLTFDVETSNGDLEGRIRSSVARFDPLLHVVGEHVRPRLMIMVSKFDHCLVDLLYRWQINELPVEIPLIVSNHPDCASIAEQQGIEFLHVPVTAETKAEAEARLLRLINDYTIDVVALARYMQVLSDDVCRSLPGRIINIHHSFLPGFKGARPYHQAFERGVKLIGATAHYVTADLDEGPIIEQDVVRVTHDQTPATLAAMGRDVERMVLARAVRLHAEHRVFLNGTRTVILG